jgi:hypothetical protein
MQLAPTPGGQSTQTTQRDSMRPQRIIEKHTGQKAPCPRAQAQRNAAPPPSGQSNQTAQRDSMRPHRIIEKHTGRKATIPQS